MPLPTHSFNKDLFLFVISFKQTPTVLMSEPDGLNLTTTAVYVVWCSLLSYGPMEWPKLRLCPLERNWGSHVSGLVVPCIWPWWFIINIKMVFLGSWYTPSVQIGVGSQCGYSDCLIWTSSGFMWRVWEFGNALKIVKNCDQKTQRVQLTVSDDRPKDPKGTADSKRWLDNLPILLPCHVYVMTLFWPYRDLILHLV